MITAVLKERIYKTLIDTVMLRAPLHTTKTVAQEDGSMAIEVETAMQDVTMDENQANVIATAVAEAVTEFLSESVVVQVPNAAAGGATLTGYLR